MALSGLPSEAVPGEEQFSGEAAPYFFNKWYRRNPDQKEVDMKMPTRIATRSMLALLCLILMALSAQMNAQNASVQFVPFREFMQSVTTANSAAFVGHPGNQVLDAASFEQMRQHILSMYNGVKVSHSFLLGSQHFDCIPINQQPSVRLLGINNIATSPPESVLAKPVSGAVEWRPPECRS